MGATASAPTASGGDTPVHHTGHLFQGFGHREIPVNTGPFTDAEYAHLKQVFARYARGGGEVKKKQAGRMGMEGFVALFDVRSEKKFAPALYAVFKDMAVTAAALASALGEEGVGGSVAEEKEEDGLGFEDFFRGVCACSRASDRSVLQVVYRVMCRLEPPGAAGGKEEALCPYTGLKEVIRLAYQCHQLATQPLSSSSSSMSSATTSAASSSSSLASAPPSPPSPTPPVDLSFDTSLFSHPYIRDHDIPPALPSFLPPSLPSSNPSSTSLSSEFALSEEEEPPLPFDEFYAWATDCFPLLYQPFAAFFYASLFLRGPSPTAFALPPSLRLALPRLLAPSSLLTAPQSVFGLALASPSLQGAWTRLYTSDENGLSFNRICHHILGYRGPTVLLVRDTTGAVFGFFTTEAWRESNGFFGSSECFLFRLCPSFIESRPKAGRGGLDGGREGGGARHFMYLNLKGFSLPHGLGVGGSVDTGFRLWIPESLEGCVAGDRDASFAWGPLAGKAGGGKGGREGEFEMEGLEVWGVGGEEAIEAACNAQGEARQMMADNIARARRVDKSKFVDNDFDKEFLLGKTFGQGKRERRGRD